MPVGLGFLSAFLAKLKRIDWWAYTNDFWAIIDETDEYVEVSNQNPYSVGKGSVNSFCYYGTTKTWRGGTIEWEASLVKSGMGSGSWYLGGLYGSRAVICDFWTQIEYLASGICYFYTKNGYVTEPYVIITDAVDDWEEKHKFKLHWERASEYPPNGRARLWIDDVLVGTLTTHLPENAACNFIVAHRTGPNMPAKSRPGVKLYSFKEI